MYSGSVLGPVLFLVFINDFPDIMNVLIKLVAYDAKLYCIVTSDNVWRMIFNIIKCHHLHIGKDITGTRYTMVSENEEIEPENVKNKKDLGVIIDQNLTFRDHITSTTVIQELMTIIQ